MKKNAESKVQIQFLHVENKKLKKKIVNLVSD